MRRKLMLSMVGAIALVSQTGCVAVTHASEVQAFITDWAAFLTPYINAIP